MDKKYERLQKLISKSGITSRRNAEKFILDKKVYVNGEIAQLGQKASFDDEILVNGVRIFNQQKKYYIMNKPPRVICSLKDERNRKVIVDLIDTTDYIFPIGRLDYTTTGLILLTNDGELTNKLLHPSSQIIRKYKARISEKLTAHELKILNSNNVIIDNIKYKQIIKYIDKKSYEIILSDGKNHHIKKIFAFINKKVLNLHRFEFAGLLLAKLAKGEYRELNFKELRHLKQITNSLD